MPLSFIIGAGSGLASALLFFSAARGSPLLSTVLLLLTPLPSLLAGFGWGWLPAAAGAVAGAVVMVFIASPLLALGFFFALGVPVVLAAYLAYLSRPDLHDPTRLQWYPPGRLLAAMSIYGATLPVLVLPLIGGSYDLLRAPLTELFRRIATRAAPELGIRPPTDQQIEALADTVTGVMPGAFSAYWLAILSANLYLAARIAYASGRLARDWPDLPGMTFPPAFPLLLVGALIGLWAPGVIGIAATSLTGALSFAYLLAGLALMHFLARARAPWILWLVYAAVLLFEPYSAIALIITGLLEPFLKLRQRFSPPPPST